MSPLATLFFPIIIGQSNAFICNLLKGNMIITIAFFNQGQAIVFNCSSYTFHKSWITWEESNKKCEQSGSKLVSMEHLRAELTFLKNYLETLETKTTEYYIGLRKDGQKWIWISDNSTLNKTKKGQFPWAPGQPKEDGNCTKMWLNEQSEWTYVYDDIFCDKENNMGYICEKSLASSECGSNGK